MLFNHYPQDLAENGHGQWQIWLLDRETGTTRFLVPGIQAQWMASDTAFTFKSLSAQGIYHYSLATSEVSEFFTCGDLNFDAQTSPDGRTVALWSNCDVGDSSGLKLVDVAGRSAKGIKERDGGFSRFPAWSPDGGRLVVYHSLGSTDFIAVIDTSGVLLARISPDLVRFDDRDPTWSRDGSWIYWDHLGPQSYQAQTGIWRAHPDGSDAQMVLRDCFYPSFAPGDSAMAFAKFDSLNRFDIWVADKNGGNQRRLLPTPEGGISARANPITTPYPGTAKYLAQRFTILR